MTQNTIELGSIAIDRLDQLITVLEETRRRGKFDILANNNPFVTRWKRKKIKDGEDAAAEAKLAVKEFRDALGTEIDLETKEFLEDTKAIDYFLGGIGAIVVQKKIVANIDEVQKVRDAVIDALHRIESVGT